MLARIVLYRAALTSDRIARSALAFALALARDESISTSLSAPAPLPHLSLSQVGGIYPMAAATAHEGAGEEEHADTRVGWAFWWQSFGALVPYLVALPLLQLPRATWASSVQFRLIMGLGALVAAVPLVMSIRSITGGAPAAASSGSAATSPKVPKTELVPQSRAAASGAAPLLSLPHSASAGALSSSATAAMDSFSATATEALLARAGHEEGEEGEAAAAASAAAEAALMRRHWYTLIGTGGTWFVYGA